jgi:hypothetical protein
MNNTLPLFLPAFSRPTINKFYKSLILNREWDVVHAEQAVKLPVVKAMADAARAVVTE